MYILPYNTLSIPSFFLFIFFRLFSPPFVVSVAAYLYLLHSITACTYAFLLPSLSSFPPRLFDKLKKVKTKLSKNHAYIYV